MKKEPPPSCLARSQSSPRAIATLGALLGGLALLAFPTASRATPEPDYAVVQKFEDFETRAYGGYTVAEVVVPGPAADAGSVAFPILAGYIFGKNKGDRQLAMTAPVTQTIESVKLDMTAPVTQTAAPGGYRVQFVLPKGVTMATAPEPLDPRITLRDIAPSLVAVVRYSGFWSEANYTQHLQKLQAALHAANLVWTGEPVYSRYNAPFTPWFLRRNEIWLHLEATP
jgi:hypothetical protein